MSGDLLRRLFRITRAYAGSRAVPPLDEVPGSDPGGGAWAGRQDGNARTETRRPGEDERLAGYYANLEIPCGSDVETVRAAWKRMMKKYHPDLHDEDPEKRQLAGELTAQLTHAYQELVAALQGPPGTG